MSLDLVGVLDTRIHAARDRLAGSELDPDRVIVASTHNHAGPDTLGFFGNPFDLGNPISGLDPEYQERLVDAIDTAVREAAGSMTEVSMKVGRVAMRDLSDEFSGAAFGGSNPTAKMHGLIHDIRDPVVVSDQLLVMQGTGKEDGLTVFTFTNWSGHPEVWGDNNNAISADFVGVTRDALEAEYGGTAIHLPESLGGMQSALGGDVPLVNADGTHVPGAWAEHDSQEFVTSLGWHIAEGAMTALAEGEPITRLPIAVEVESFWTPLSNLIFNVLVPSGCWTSAWTSRTRTRRSARSTRQTGTSSAVSSRERFWITMGPVGFSSRRRGRCCPSWGGGCPSTTRSGKRSRTTSRCGARGRSTSRNTTRCATTCSRSRSATSGSSWMTATA